MGKLTISTGPCSIAMLVYQRVFHFQVSNSCFLKGCENRVMGIQHRSNRWMQRNLKMSRKTRLEISKVESPMDFSHGFLPCFPIFPGFFHVFPSSPHFSPWILVELPAPAIPGHRQVSVSSPQVTTVRS